MSMMDNLRGPLPGAMDAGAAMGAPPPDQQGMQLVPTDDDPFNDPEGVKVILHQMATLEQRLFTIEMSIAQAASGLQGALAQFGQVMAELRASSDRLQQTMAAPKRVIRDAEGRLQGVAVDLPTPQSMLPAGFMPPPG